MCELVIMPTPTETRLPGLITTTGERAPWRFVEIFTFNVHNRNNWSACSHAAGPFLRWRDGQGVRELLQVQPVHAASYIEELPGKRSESTVKQHLVCIRRLFDWLVAGQVVASNPAHAVRRPRHSVTMGSTPVLTSEEATALLTGMDV